MAKESTLKNNISTPNKYRKNVLHAKLAPTCFATMLALGMIMPASAAITADTSAANQPSIHTGANGATVVDINKASEGGVSHNVYSEFNVDANGVILNNSGSSVNTQLSGNIAGNANMADGSATVILNEVRSSDPSQLNGMIEVAGQSAQVIIANPSGITCDGCGFINTNHASLTTGTATFDDNNKLTGLDVKKGQIVITGKGMDTTSSQYTDIIARSVKVNAQLKANELNIITGSNHIDTKGAAKAIAGTDNAPTLALDVSSLGSMYANKIYMKGTESGVGVNIDHANITAADTINIDANGKINNNGGNITAQNSVALKSGNDILNNKGNITSEGLINLSSANGAVDNSNGNIDGNDVYISAKQAVNNGAGNIHAVKAVSITTDSLNNTAGNINGENQVFIGSASGTKKQIPGSGLINENGKITSKGDVSIQATNLSNKNGSIDAGSTLGISANTLNNQYGSIRGGNTSTSGLTSISVKDLNNNDGSIIVKGKNSKLVISASNSLTNQNGTISGAGDAAFSGTLDNTSGSVSAGNDLVMSLSDYTSDSKSSIAGNNINMNISDNFQNAGTISSKGNISLVAGNSRNIAELENTGNINAAGKLTIQKQGGYMDNSGTLSAANITMSATNINNSGTITTPGDIIVNGDTLNNIDHGKILAGNNISATVYTLNTEKGSVISAGKDVTTYIRKDFHNAGDIKAGEDVTISSSYKNGDNDNYGSITANKAVNITMNDSTLYNGGEINGKSGVKIYSKALSNSGNISSVGDVNLVGRSGITNMATGTITGYEVSTTGILNNAGTITETAAPVKTPTNSDTSGKKKKNISF
ncbi:TPA: filamentous hemagglutinin N-terminal domain-containing protein [Citrobacter farmeri]|nr:filamentous hemagglutinin N-terminal domain-containing protein [Citrobacter farmeri]